MSARLRVVVFAAGPLAAVDRAFCERLAGDPRLDLRAIVVDGTARARRPGWWRIVRGLQQDGWGWLWFKTVTGSSALARRVARAVFDRMHRPIREESYAALARETGIAVHHVADIHGDQGRDLVRSLKAQLGLVVGEGEGGLVLGDAVLSIPEYGTLRLQKHKLPDYRGGAPVGYWEVLAGESAIGVTVHYATAQVDAGDVLAQVSVPIEECDTLASLRIKADLAGARLYHDAIRAFAAGPPAAVPQTPHEARTYRPPSAMRVWRLERRLRRRAARQMPVLRERPAAIVRARVLLQYLLVSPLLFWWRRRLRGQRRSPVCILFYHLVANRPLNHMCLPLEDFVAQMELLRRHYPLLSLTEAAERIGRERSEDVAVALTFDDGYRDNVWAIEYLRQFGIPACFFVSIGNVLDGSAFEHDERRGFAAALPFREADVARLAAEGFEVGSHGLYHEDFGTLDGAAAEQVLGESRRLIGQSTGTAPDHFSFPKGQRGTNITPETFSRAVRHYRHVYSAYGGYNIPGRQTRSHLLRLGNPVGAVELAMMLDGYTGLRECLSGNAWGLKTSALVPYALDAETSLRVDPRPGELLPRTER